MGGSDREPPTNPQSQPQSRSSLKRRNDGGGSGRTSPTSGASSASAPREMQQNTNANTLPVDAVSRLTLPRTGERGRRSTLDREEDARQQETIMKIFAQLIPAIISFQLYFGTIWGGFVLDDRKTVVENVQLRSDFPISGLWTHDYWGMGLKDPDSHKSFRPLTVLTLRLNYMFSELDARYYHVTNILLYCLCTVLFVRVAHLLFDDHWIPGKRRLTFGRHKAWLVAGLSGVMFAVHPVHSEAVANITGRAEILSAIFAFLAFESFFRPDPTKDATDWPGVQRTLLAVVFLAAGTLCKENSLAFAGVLVLVDIVRSPAMPPNRELDLPKRANWVVTIAARQALIVAATILIIAARIWCQGDMPSLHIFSREVNPALHDPSFATRTMTYAYLNARAAFLLVFPFDLHADYSRGSIPLVTEGSDIRNIFTLSVFSCIVIIAFWAIRRSPRALLAIGFAIVSFVPASSLFVSVGFTIAERTLFLPSSGFCILMGLMWRHYHNQWRPRKRPRSMDMHILTRVHHLAFLCWAVVWGARTITRNKDWASQLRLWTVDVNAFPRNAFAHYNRALQLKEAGLYQDAIDSFAMCLVLDPCYPEAASTLGNLYLNNERSPELAIRWYEAEIACNPSYGPVYMNLGNAYLEQGRHEEAIRYISASAASTPPKFVKYNLGLAHLRSRAYEQAVGLFSDVIDIDPHFQNSLVLRCEAMYHAMLQSSYTTEESLACLRDAMARAPSPNAAVHLRYGQVLQKSDRGSEALKHFREAAQLQPGLSSARLQLGAAEYAEGNLVKAMKELNAAKQIGVSAEEEDDLKRYLDLCRSGLNSSKTKESSASSRSGSEERDRVIQTEIDPDGKASAPNPKI